jgi:hypothetical protein
MADGTQGPIMLETQGSFAIGGTAVANEHGNAAHVDHAYVQYQVPVDARDCPLVMWHGGGQFSKTWESTPDGREGFQTLFLRRGFPVYILDQPRRGRGGRAAEAVAVPPSPLITVLIYNVFRLGIWAPPQPPEFFANVQFPCDEDSLDQYWRQQAADVGAEERDAATRELMAAPVVALFDKIGPGVLITHSNSGQYGWMTAIRNPKVKAIVSYEPGTFCFPSDAPPEDIPTDDPLVGLVNAPFFVSPEEFARLTEIPIQLVYGDNIEKGAPSPITGVELWRANIQRARQFRDTINARGGQVELLELPDAGLHGNTHFPFSDLNNVAVADLLSDYLRRHGLAR